MSLVQYREGVIWGNHLQQETSAANEGKPGEAPAIFAGLGVVAIAALVLTLSIHGSPFIIGFTILAAIACAIGWLLTRRGAAGRARYWAAVKGHDNRQPGAERDEDDDWYNAMK